MRWLGKIAVMLAVVALGLSVAGGKVVWAAEPQCSPTDCPVTFSYTEPVPPAETQFLKFSYKNTVITYTINNGTPVVVTIPATGPNGGVTVTHQITVPMTPGGFYVLRATAVGEYDQLDRVSGVTTVVRSDPSPEAVASWDRMDEVKPGAPTNFQILKN